MTRIRGAHVASRVGFGDLAETIFFTPIEESSSLSRGRNVAAPQPGALPDPIYRLTISA